MGFRVTGGLLRCGRCGKHYSNPFGHVCVTRADSRRKRRRTTLASPKLTWSCPNCGKQRGLSHTCQPRSDFKARKRQAVRKAATDERRRRREAARARERAKRKATRERQAARRKQAAADRRARERARKAAARTRSPRPRARTGESHEPGACGNRDCPKYGCQAYFEGFDEGLDAGYAAAGDGGE